MQKRLVYGYVKFAFQNSDPIVLTISPCKLKLLLLMLMEKSNYL